MAKEEAAQASGGGISIVAVLIMSLLAVGGGVGFGMVVPGLVKQDASKKADEPAMASEYANARLMVPIGPITTNLARPKTTWIRLESVLVIEKELGKDAELLKRQMSEDILGYLRTVTLEQLSGSSGFQHLREDLNDRVRVRSDGKVSNVVITSMILE